MSGKSATARLCWCFPPAAVDKTVVAADVIEHQVTQGVRVLFMAHREELLSQAADKIRQVTGLESALEKAESTGLGSMFPVTVGSVQSLCREHLDGLYAVALGERGDIPKKPAPDGVNRIIDALGASRARTLYVGDGDTDLLPAQNAGIDCAWVSWGYRRRDELGDLEVPYAFDTARTLGAHILG